jgi:germination protein M
MQINLYFLNMANSNIEREIRNIETPTSNTELINAVLRELIKGPENNWLYRTIPRDVTIEVAELTENEKLCEITLSPEYTLLPVKDEIFCRSSLVWTLTEFDFIDDVVIYVSGQQLQGLSGQAAGVMNRENLSVNPVLSPHRPNSQTITLYFANADLSALTPEARTIEVTNTIEYHIVEQLIKGPVKEGVNPTLLPEIKLKATDTLEGICYVDFGPEFLSRQLTGNMSADALVIGSIVNSLTELSSVTMVQIIVDSNTVTGVWGGYDLSIPVSRDENVIE